MIDQGVSKKCYRLHYFINFMYHCETWHTALQVQVTLFY